MIQAAFLEEARQLADREEFSYYEYFTSQGFLNKKPHPVQSIILKLMDGIELDDSEYNVKMFDNTGEHKYNLTEKQFLKMAYEEERCNWSEQQTPVNRLNLMVGRRGGKSWLDGGFLSGAVYRFLQIENPYEKYMIDDTTDIRMGSISSSEDNATIIFNEISSHIKNTSLFQPFKYKEHTQSFDFWHPCMADKFTDPRDLDKRSLRVLPLASSSKTARGPAYWALVLDEFGHYPHQHGPASAKEILKALRPAVGTFGEDGLLIISSSPPDIKTYPHTLYLNEMEKGHDSEFLICRFPTWWTNPNPYIMSDVSKAYKTDPASASVEYGAEFGSAGSRWLPPEITESIQIRRNGTRSKYFFTGTDIAFGRDAASICTVVPTSAPALEVVDFRYFAAGEQSYGKASVVPPEHVAGHLDQVTKRFSPSMILADQYEIFSFMALLGMQTVNKLRDIHFTERLNTVIYEVLQDFLLNDLIIAHNYPELIKSLEGLVSYRPTPKKLIVTAKSGERDDPADALARAVFAFIMYCRQYPVIASTMPFNMDNLHNYNASAAEIDARLINGGLSDYQISKAERYRESASMLGVRQSTPSGVGEVRGGRVERLRRLPGQSRNVHINRK